MPDLRLDVVDREDGRALCWNGSAVALTEEVSARLESLRPGDVVLARCRYDATTQSLRCERLLGVTEGGGDSAWELATGYFRRGLKTEALRVLEGIDSDSRVPALRARILVDCGRNEDAVESLCALFTRGAELNLRGPWGMQRLWLDLDGDARQTVREAATEAVDANRFPATTSGLIPVFDHAPAEQWPAAFLAWRIETALTRGEAGRVPEWLEAAQVTLSGDPRVEQWAAELAALQAGRGRVALRAETHPILEAALDVSPAPMHPPVIHAGGTQPRLRAVDQAGIAVWMAHAVAGWAPPEDAAEVEELVRLADEALPRVRRKEPGAVEALDPDTLFPRNTVQPISVVRLAAAAVVYALTAPANVGNAVQAAARRVARIVKRNDEAALGAFLAELDNRLMLAELRERAERYAPRSAAKLQRVVYRPIGNRTPTALWLAELSDGRWALHVKQKRRWSWLEASLEEILASVPDAFFRGATRAAEADL